ncbi:TIGR00645 family protein [Lysobacter tyrosinilyticus]
MSDVRSDARLNPLPALIFSSRWLQLPLYLGLIVAQGVYVVLFGKELWHLIHETPRLSEQDIMLIVLGLIDVVMISNLLMMVIVGGYETFVSRLRLEGHPDQPEWLSHVNASVLKVKLAMAIIGISSIHLLKSFIEAGMIDGLPLCSSIAGIEAVKAMQPLIDAGGKSIKACTSVTSIGVMWQTIIHGLFILSAIGIAYTDKLMTATTSRREHTAH